MEEKITKIVQQSTVSLKNVKKCNTTLATLCKHCYPYGLLRCHCYLLNFTLYYYQITSLLRRVSSHLYYVSIRIITIAIFFSQ